MSQSTPAEEFWTKAFIVFSLFCAAFLLHGLLEHRPHGSRCGVVVKKILPQDVDITKSVATVNYNEYFVIRYDDGEFEKVKVDTDTFYKHKENSRVCFDVPPVYSGWYIMSAIIAALVVLVDIIWLGIIGVERFNDYLNK